MKIEIGKYMYCKDKENGEVCKIDSINFPLGKKSGKDTTVIVEDDLVEWRSINDVEILDDAQRGSKTKNRLVAKVSITNMELFKVILSTITRIITDERINKEIRQAYLEEFISNVGD